MVCGYAACWGPTKTRGVDDVAMQVHLEAVADLGSGGEPLDVTLLVDHFAVTANVPFVVGAYIGETMSSGRQVHYFWFFGYVAKLPYERDIKPVVDGVSGAT